MSRYRSTTRATITVAFLLATLVRADLALAQPETPETSRQHGSSWSRGDPAGPATSQPRPSSDARASARPWQRRPTGLGKCPQR